MPSKWELELHLIMMRSLNLDLVIAEARKDPDILRRMIASFKDRAAGELTDEDASLLRWAEALLEMHRLKDLPEDTTDNLSPLPAAP